MKFLGLIASICIALTTVACGDDNWAEAGNSKAANANTAKPQAADADSKEADAVDAKPSIKPPNGPPPKEVVIEDLETGSGPAAAPGDSLEVRFVAVNQAGKEVYDLWSEGPPLSFELGKGEYGAGWDKGLIGAKTGGQRELSIPQDQAYENQGPLYYVVEVLGIKPASSKDGAAQAGGANRDR